MAKCTNCGANVGCSCNLYGGLCISCKTKHNKITTIAPKQDLKVKFSQN